jgi:hypothetical protein
MPVEIVDTYRTGAIGAIAALPARYHSATRPGGPEVSELLFERLRPSL